MRLKKISLGILLVVSILFCLAYWKYLLPGYLTFSDAAKFADVARNIVNQGFYGSTFSFFSNFALVENVNGIFPAMWILPLMPMLIAINFLIWGIGDFAVIFTSSLMFLGIVLMTYLIANKLFGTMTAFLSGIAVATNINLLNYATSGASETLLIFLILATIYVFLQKRRGWNFFGLLLLILLFLSRPHAPIYIAGLWLFYLLVNVKKEKFVQAIAATIIGAILIELLLQQLPDHFFIQSVINRAKIASLDYSQLSEGNNSLRGELPTVSSFSLLNIKILFTKMFYNLYNFYKNIAPIISPYLWAFFLLGLIKRSKDNNEKSFKISVVFTTILTFIAVAITVPFYRYLHPIIPLVYIISISTLVWVIQKLIDEQWTVITKIKVFKNIQRKSFIFSISLLTVVIFVIGQTIGNIFLDSRYINDRANNDKPPVYVILSQKLKEITTQQDIVLTNLDTWGSWYGERTTVWFPLDPDQLEQLDSRGRRIDAIYLTSYLMDDENYYMGDEWRQIFYNPEDIQNEYIESNYKVKDIYEISGEETYENQSARAVLLIREN